MFIIFVVIIIVATLYSLFWLRRYKKYNTPPIIGEAILSVPTNEKIIALTFDDGPNPPYTTQILELLTQYGARATFFVVGQNVQNHPDTVRNLFHNGNELGNHS